MSDFMNIQQLRESIERDIADLDQRISDQIQIGIEEVNRAKAEGRTLMTRSEQVRHDAMLADIRKMKASKGRMEARLAEAKRVEAEEAEYDAAARDTHPTNAAPQRRTTAVHVTRNERTYRPDNDPNGSNFLADVARSHLGDATAWGRLERHMQEERIERPGLAERAAGDAPSTAFAGLVIPQYLIDMAAPAVAARRPFANAVCTHHDLPAEGMKLEIAKGTASSVANQSAELAAVSATSMTSTMLEVPVNTAAGQQLVSRQAAERGRIEPFIVNDLMARYATNLDYQLIYTATTGLDAVAAGTAVTTVDLAHVYPAILGKQAAIEAALLGPAVDYVVMHSRRWAWLSAQLASTWPFVNEQGGALENGAARLGAGNYGDGVRGVLPNGLKVVVDNNLKVNQGTSTNEDYIYVVPSYEAHLWEDPNAPMLIRAEQPAAGQLGILLVVYGYYAASFQRYDNAMGKLTGLTTPSF